MPLSLRYAARSDVGLVRQGNEDSGYAGPRLLAVADGMGGHAAGEVASAVALSALAPLDDDEGVGDLLDALSAAVTTAQENLSRVVEVSPELEGMGTTLTALLWSGTRIGLAHVGDSRAYLLRDGALVQLTRDHTYVQTLVDSGRITLEEAASHPRRSLITRALGNGNDARPDLSIREVRAGDRFLLCSDGLSAVVSEGTITDTLATGTPSDAVDQLVELALRSGGPDNITAIVADVVEHDDRAPEVETLVVGAAGAEGEGAGPSLRTPAGRAAAALRTTPVQPPPSTEPSPEAKARQQRWVRRVIVGALVIVVGVVAVVMFTSWTRTQYFVGNHDGQVTIYRGIPQDVLGFDLSTVYEVQQQIPISSLPQAQQGNVNDTIHAANLEKARAIVDSLAADSCTANPALTDCAPDGVRSTTTASPTASPSGAPIASPTAPGVVGTTTAGQP